MGFLKNAVLFVVNGTIMSSGYELEYFDYTVCCGRIMGAEVTICINTAKMIYKSKSQRMEISSGVIQGLT